MVDLSQEAQILAGVPQEKPKPPPEVAHVESVTPDHEDGPSAEVVEPIQPGDDTGQETEAAEPQEEEVPELVFVKEMYDLELPGLGMTIGEYKDRAKDLKEADTLVAEAEERQITVQNQLLSAQQDLQVFAAKIGVQPSEQDLAEIRAQRTEFNRQQTLSSVRLYRNGEILMYAQQIWL